MTKKPTIYDIKYDVENSKENCYFFSYKTLKFFGQTMKSFSVRKSPSGRIFILAPSYWDNHLMGYTFKEYKDHNLINPLFDDNTQIPKTKEYLQTILDYIQSH